MTPITAHASVVSVIEWIHDAMFDQGSNAVFTEFVAERSRVVTAISCETPQVDQAMVDLEDGDLRIPTRIHKDYPNDQGPDPATFELDPAGVLGTVDAIEEYLDDRDDSAAALFPSQKGSRMTPKGINDVVQRAARRAEIRPYSYERRSANAVSSHTLRHSVAWRMLRAEEDNRLYHVRNRLRHSSILTTEREYDHFQRI